MSGTPLVRIVDITPAQAELWLKSKAPNRSFRKRVVEKYADDMRNGRWVLTHQGICFDESGALTDGQHRLAAIVLSGVTLRTVVTSGIPRAAQMEMDQHSKRSAEDALRISGFETNQERVAIAKAMMTCCKGGDGTISIGQLRAFMEIHHSAITFADEAMNGTKVKQVTIAPVLAAVAAAFYVADPERLRRFCDVLVSGFPGEPVMEDSSALSLRSVLQAAAGTAHKGAAQRRDLYLKTQRAIKAFLDREPLKKIYAASNDIYIVPGTAASERSEVPA